MDTEEIKPERDPSKPVNFDTYMDYQGDGPCAGARMTSYLNAIQHYDWEFERILQATDFKELQKELLAFRLDRHLFYLNVVGTWDKDAKKYIKPSPEAPT